MEDFNFTSQICTTREQSERLLALGLKKETADMYYFWMGGNEYRLKIDIDNNPLKYNMVKTYIPAWSLHRLLEILGIWYLELWFNTDVYEQVITHIQERVEGGLYNKKIFEDQKQIAMEK